MFHLFTFDVQQQMLEKLIVRQNVCWESSRDIVTDTQKNDYLLFQLLFLVFHPNCIHQLLKLLSFKLKVIN
jgi:hypothetical protein